MLSNNPLDHITSYSDKIGIPSGLSNLLKNNDIKNRYFIWDNSGSMMKDDGERIISQGNNNKKITCSRWEELKDTLLFCLKISHEENILSEFRFLNNIEPKIIGDRDIDPDNCNYRAIETFIKNQSPSGGTPLCKHIDEIVISIQEDELNLRNNNEIVSLIICTDGIASDGDITKSMRPLKNLPCTILIRLCTNEDEIIDYWNKVDKDLELQLDIIDDFFGEGKEVYSCNPWINYGLFLHRIREFGIEEKVFDIIDEYKLSVNDMLKYMSILFNCQVSTIPNPNLDWYLFENWVKEQNNHLKLTFDPNTLEKMPEHWINIKKLRECYKPEIACCIIF